MNTTVGSKGTILTNNWSVQYDGRSIIEFMMEKANCPYGHAKQIIENEGGYVDSDGIIHKGTAENKIGLID